MSVAVSYPGVYVEEDASVALSVRQSATAIPVFVGQFSSIDGTPLEPGTCIRVDNWAQFSSRFSLSMELGVLINSYQKDSVWLHTVSEITGTYNPALAVQHYFQNGGGPCYVLPLIETNDESEIAALPAAVELNDDITLLVALSDDAQIRNAVYNALNTLLTNGDDYFLIADSPDGNPASNPSTLAEKTAIYYPDLITSYPYVRQPDSETIVKGYKDDAAHADGADMTLKQLKTFNSTVYNMAAGMLDDVVATGVVLPPSGTVAGVYCLNDLKYGVWNAPANQALSSTTGVRLSITDDVQGGLNDAGINAIRRFSGRGVLVWGARTLAGAASNADTSWRYVPVRRLFNSAERDIRKAMNTMVFQPNHQPTWERTRSAIRNYLSQLWRDGALKGETEAEAYFVEIGENITMTADDIAQGRMIAKVGMAAVRPAEFIVLEFTQNMA